MNTIGILRAAAIITVAAASTYSITASASPATRFGQPFARQQRLVERIGPDALE